MPYTQVEADIAIEVDDVTVYHTYRDDIIDNPPWEYWYEVEGIEFDIRELPNAKSVDVNDVSTHRGVLAAAIRQRLLPLPLRRS